MSEKKGTVTLYVYALVDGIPTALAGATVTISPDPADVPQPGKTDQFGAYTVELPEGHYSATASFNLGPGQPPRPRGAQATSRPKAFESEEPVPFHVCEGEPREHLIKVNLRGSTISIVFSEDNTNFVAFSSQSTPLRYGQPIYMRVEWKRKASRPISMPAALKLNGCPAEACPTEYFTRPTRSCRMLPGSILLWQ